MKKLLSLLLALSLVLSLAGCAFAPDLSTEDIGAIVDGLEELEQILNETQELTETPQNITQEQEPTTAPSPMVIPGITVQLAPKYASSLMVMFPYSVS